MTEQLPDSPSWGQTTKLVLGLTFMAIIAALLVRFRDIIGPMILTFILSFLLHPVAARLSAWLRVSWRVAVNLIYLVLLLLLLGSFTATGFAIVQQIQLLLITVNRFLVELPVWMAELSNQTLEFGPFVLEMSQFDLISLSRQVLDLVQPLLGQAGNLVSMLASGAASVLGWGLFILLVSYFLLSESHQVSGQLVAIDIPGYNTDLQRLGKELGKIWNAFFRGQLLISLLVVIVYAAALSILGLRFTLAISLMAGAARFIPWLGPLITWMVTALVAFLQTSNYFGLPSVYYALLVIVVCLVLDQIFDNLVNPRLMGHTLGVHPAGVLISAIIVTQLIGLIGLVLAAPLLATVNLLGRYVLRKMLDLDPWPQKVQDQGAPKRASLRRLLRRFKAWLRLIRQRMKTLA
jgi:predicted PurR-regulated permease PerM